MKQRRRPTKAQKEMLAQRNLDPSMWYVTKNLQHMDKLHIVHRHGGKERVLTRRHVI